jgi:transcriptional regulator with XRE-family HTH domain
VPDTPSVWDIIKPRGITLRELERRTGLGEAHISMLVRGERGGTLKTFLRLIDGSGLPAMPMLRALVRAREEYLAKRRVRNVLDSYASRRLSAAR